MSSLASPPFVQPAANLFGQIVTPRMVEKAVAACLDIWMDTYLGQVERIDGYEPGQIVRPLGIITRSQFQRWPEEQLPCLLVMAAGLGGQRPERRADSSYRASWMVGIACIVSDATQDDTRDLALAYATAVRAAIGQHRMLKSALWPLGFGAAYWEDESYSDMPSRAERTLGASRVIFSVAVENVLTETAGPREPLADASEDPGNWPSATIQPATPVITPIGIEDTVS
jgi:hypothetical protein